MEMQKNQNVQPPQAPAQAVAPIKAQASIITEPEPKPLFTLTKGDIAFAVSALIAAVFTSLFGLFSGFALGYAISIIITALVFIFYLIKGKKGHISPIIYGILSIAGSAIFVCTSNGSVRFFGMVLSFLLSLVCYDGITNSSPKGNRKTVGVFYSAASSLGNMGIAVKSLFSCGKSDKKVIGKAFIGLACALPVLIIVIPLLISSDVAFKGMMISIFDNTFSTILKIIFGLLLAFFIIPYGFSLKTGRVAKMKKGSFTGIENVYIISFLSAIAFCYLLYLFSQLAYFFSAFKGFLPEGYMNYSQYARKGFFEMCTIAVINLIIVFLTWFLAKKQNGKMCHGIKAIATFISLFTLTIIATAISKMVLYINAYGMTVLRITTSAFMLFLAIVFISVILKIFIKKINFVKTALIAASLIVLTLGITNVNSVCAKYNYEAYISQRLETIDINALYNLGDEGIPYIVKLARSENTEIAEEAEEYLIEAYIQDYFNDMRDINYLTVEDLKQNRKYKGLESFSIPKSKAYNSLYQYLDETPGFSYTCLEHIENQRYDYIF